MESRLLLLGLLRAQEMHGYQLNEFIDSHLSASVQLTKPTAYRLLNQMADDGWVTWREERQGNRPPRRVYTITGQGEKAFQRLLRESLANYQPVDLPGNVGLLFLDAIPVAEALSLLQKRRTVVEGLLETACTHRGHKGGAELVLLHRVRHLSTELEWLDEVVGRLDSHAGARPPGEGPEQEARGEADAPSHPHALAHEHPGYDEGEKGGYLP